MDWRGGGTALGSSITKNTSFDVVVKKNLLNKSFSELTDQELLEVVTALDNNLITTTDLNWKVGDTRTVSLGAFTSYPNASASTQAAQTAQLVIYHVGSAGIKFTNGIDVNYVVGFKNCVTKSSYDGSDNTYSSSDLKTTENNIYNALPSALKPAFKRFNAYTAANGYATSVTAYPVYMCSPAEKEIFGSRTYSIQAEADALTQFDYFKTSNNRIKQINGSNTSWWERSPESNDLGYACKVYNNGVTSSENGGSSIGISPFGCI